MKAFQKVSSIAAYLPIANIDTDMLIPKQYLKTIKRTGLGQYLLADLRYDEHGNPKPDFILNQTPYNSAQILIAEENFGCGSSREHAAWALYDFGIRVVIAPSFADIYYNNGFKNGILNITLPRSDIEKISNEKSPIHIDLEKQIIEVASVQIIFSIEEFRREALLKGLDEIGETLQFENQIQQFEEKQKGEMPWLYGSAT